MKPCRDRFTTAFSLVEVTLSIAIVAAVLLPLLALLSRGGGSVTESEDRFATARIVRSIESEIRYAPEEKAFFIGSESAAPGGTIRDILVPAASTNAVYLGYDRSAALVREISKGEFSAGIPDTGSGIFHLVEVRFSKSTHHTQAGIPALYEIHFSVEQPAFTAAEHRSRERLQTLLSGQ